jgi:drug/metabolite transporter (DMT)-like permease
MWIQLSLFVLVIQVLQDVVHRYFMYLGYGPIEIVMYGLVPSVIVGLIYMAYQSKKIKIPTSRDSIIFIVSGIVSFFTFLWIRQAQILSPNIGYVSIIIYTSAFATIVLTGLLFKDKIDVKGLIGSAFIIFGMVLVASTGGDKPQSVATPTLQ